jgi:peroxiredoxin
MAPDFVGVTGAGEKVTLSGLLDRHEAVVLVFYRGFFCGICRGQLVELQQAYPAFRERNVEIVGVSTDGLDGAANMAGYVSASYPILPDPERRVVTSYGVFDLLGDGVAAPAVFIVGKDRSLLWGQVGMTIAERPSAEDVLRQLDRVLG